MLSCTSVWLVSKNDIWFREVEKNPNTAGRDQSPPFQTQTTDGCWDGGREVERKEQLRGAGAGEIFMYEILPLSDAFLPLNLFFPLQCVWCLWILSAWLRSPFCIIAPKLKCLTGHHFGSKAVFATTDHEMDPVKRLQSNERCPEMSYSKVNQFYLWSFWWAVPGLGQ